MDEVELVRHYLRGQNLEQVGRTDEAIELYEAAVSGAFDSAGPYDRLIALYGQRAEHREVIRICDAALGQVRTYDQKRAWYRKTKEEAGRAGANVPTATPKKR